jgi:PhnB protein
LATGISRQKIRKGARTVQLNPYLVFNGQCEAAFKFYEKALGGKIESMMTHGDSPMSQQVPPEWKNKIMHARMIVDGQILMGSDAPPNHYEKPSGFSLSINVKDPSDAERLFNELAESGQVRMPLQQTFWAARFGMLVDRFDIPWMVNCEGASASAAS